MSKVFQLLSDEPLSGSKQDSLGFGKYAQILTNLTRATPGPFTFGIHGAWGTGKTSLLRKIEDNLNTEASGDKILTVWFNAWQFEADERPLIAMVLTIINAIDDKVSTFESKQQKAVRSLEKTRDALAAIGSGFLAGLTVKSAIKVPLLYDTEITLSGKDVTDVIKEKLKSEQVNSLRQLEQLSDYYRSFKALSAACDDLVKNGYKLVIFIDDLDRCMPERSFTLLQDVKLVLNQPGFIYFMALDLKNIRTYIQKNYDDSEFYLDKLMQVPFHIPSPGDRQEKLIDSLLDDMRPESRGILGELLKLMSDNPRAIKRLINTVLLLNEMYATDKNEVGQQDGMLLYFAFEVFLRLYQPKFYIAYRACSSVELELTGEWKFEERDQEVTGPATKEMWDILEGNGSLRRLYDSPGCKVWLKAENEDKRRHAMELSATQQVNSVSTNDNYGELLSRADISMVDNNIPEAKSLLSRAIGTSPDTPDAYQKRANVYIKEKNWESAIRDLSRAAQLDQTDVTSLRSLGRCYRKVGNDKKAIGLLTKAISKFPNNPGLYIERGTVLYQGKLPEFHQAIEDFERAANLDPGNLEADLHYRWARALWLQAGGKRADKKLRSTLVPKLKKALDIDPGHNRAKDWLDALNG